MILIFSDASPFLDISKIEYFDRNNFKCWQEHRNYHSTPQISRLNCGCMPTRKYYWWEMYDYIDMKMKINEYQKLLEDLKTENITFLEEFNDYKQQIKHKYKKISLKDLIMHMIIEDTNCKEVTISKRKEISILSNLICGKSKRVWLKNIVINLKFNTLPSRSKETIFLWETRLYILM
ncbi:hypothetical protein CXB51_005892 [Gossypium anomalum]|uniref:Uncharacterized protein n=1 Tax=Gossypium anomalum TaxID=47600 RepID=A0A8J6D5I1_9ROSI|nr:hypothetical protein CXB51_005892 [Gossypium anomalum]